MIAAPSAANLLQGIAAVGPCLDGQTNEQTDWRTDGRMDTVPLHRPCFACYAGSANRMVGIHEDRGNEKTAHWCAVSNKTRSRR